MTPSPKSTILYQKTLGCLLGGLIGDAIGTPTEGLDYGQIEARFGWVDDFDCDSRETIPLTLEGVDATRDDWVEKAISVASTDQEALAQRLAEVAVAKVEREAAAQAAFARIAGSE